LKHRRDPHTTCSSPRHGRPAERRGRGGDGRGRHRRPGSRPSVARRPCSGRGRSTRVHQRLRGRRRHPPVARSRDAGAAGSKGAAAPGRRRRL